ncbi:MAG: LysM domain-containing protein [Actinobacteria bacterium]|nr:LysM domain-containing protein [Actinomycetota bacterium]
MSLAATITAPRSFTVRGSVKPNGGKQFSDMPSLLPAPRPQSIAAELSTVATPVATPVAARFIAHSTALVAVAAPAAPIRVTRRGRLLMTFAAAVGLTTAIMGAASFIAPPPAAGSVPTVGYVIQPGDTLWSVARSLPHHGDIREVVAELRTLNPSANKGLAVGAQIRVPKS